MTETNILHIFSDVFEKFESAGIPYMVVGSVASIIYGEPRMTKDMDLVVAISPMHARSFDKLFPNTEYYCPPPEVIRDEIVRQGQFNLVHHKSGLKIDIMIQKSTAHARTEFERRQLVDIMGNIHAYFARPEDIIIKKLEYFREGESEKHLTDIRGILANTTVDDNYLSAWIATLNLSVFWDKARS